jgi:NADH:ubiquinone oxidoreductase subunit 3 (subunit A)
MKLILLFIAMDLFTVLAYPLIFAYGKLHQFADSKEG